MFFLHMKAQIHILHYGAVVAKEQNGKKKNFFNKFSISTILREKSIAYFKCILNSVLDVQYKLLHLYF